MKKRIISLLLALSMMISLVPVSALANTGGGIAPLAAGESETADSVPGSDLELAPRTSNTSHSYPTRNSGAGGAWSYDGETLYLYKGTYDLSKVKPTDSTSEACKGHDFLTVIGDSVVVTGFPSDSTKKVTVKNGGKITGGSFRVCDVVIEEGGVVTGGYFAGTVTNSGTIENGLFNLSSDEFVNYGTVNGAVISGSTIFENDTLAQNGGKVAAGYFLQYEPAYYFKCVGLGGELDNAIYQHAYIIPNANAEDYPITFYPKRWSGVTVDYWDVSVDGGTTTPLETWNGITMNDYDTTTFTINPGVVSNRATVTLTAGTRNYKSELEIGEDGKPVTENRKPYGADGKGVQGDGWTYDGTTLKLIASDTSDVNNEYDFSKDATIQAKVEVGKNVTVNNGTFADSVKNYGTIKNGKIKFCYNYGIIEGGTFDNTGMRYCASNYGTISNGTFKQNVDNNKDATKGTGTISGGGFEYVENHGVITDGTFKQCLNYGTVQGGEFISDGDYTCLMNDGEVQGGVVKGNVTNTKDCTISGGVFYKPVTNIGNIKGGMFLSTVSNSSNGGSISGGVFKNKPSDSSIANGGAYSITADGDGREISIKTSNVSDFVDFGTDGAYVVRTTSVQPEIVVKISAVIDTINGKSVSEYGAYEDDEHKSIKLTMPAEDIVLNQGATVTTYTLTVDGGYIGEDKDQTSGEFEANAQIKVTAKAKNGYHFTKWTVEKGTLNLSEKELEANPLTFDMLGELSLKANYEEDTPDPTPTPTTYTLTVKGDGAYIQDPTTGNEFEAGTLIKVDINVPDGKIFTGWTVSDGVKLSYIGADVDLHSEQIIFNMPAANVTLTANLIDQRTNILFNEDGTLNLDGVKNNSGDGWYYSEGALYLNPATATEYDFTHVNPSDKDSEKLDAVKVPIHVVNSTVTIKGGTFEAEVESTVADATFKNCIFKGEVDIQAICNVDNCIFTKSSTITNLYGEQNCLFEKEPGESIMTYELTEKTGATVTATLDGCEGEVSGTTLYFTGTPTLKVKVADGIVEKANNKPVGKADANGWYTVKAAEDDDGIVLTKGEKTTPNPDPDDQPKTYTVTVKGGTINNETEVKAEKDIKLTVDVDEKEVPEGMTFDVWSIRFPEGIEDTLTPSVKLHDPHMTFTMPGADITIEAQYRSSELPGEDDGPSTLGTMATVAVGGAAAGILVWQGVSLGVDSYLQLNLPQGVAVPANRRELVVLLWETAGKPEAALPSLYSDVPAEEIELQKATRWAIDNGLVKPADDSDASRFDPDRYVTKYDVFGAWLKLKKLMKL